MRQNSEQNGKGEYVLATGSAAANHLRILHITYGPGSRRVLLQPGIKTSYARGRFWGRGIITQLIAELVGPTGEVVGID